MSDPLASAGLVGLLLGTAACGGSDDGGGDAEAGAVSDVSEAGDPVDGGHLDPGTGIAEVDVVLGRDEPFAVGGRVGGVP